MDAQARKRLLQAQIDEAEALRSDLAAHTGEYDADGEFTRRWHERFGTWRVRTEAIFRRLYGADSEPMKAFSYVFFGDWSAIGPDSDDYLARLPTWKSQLETLLWELEEFPEAETATETPHVPPKVFIAHSGETPALNRLLRFLRALGVDPQVAEWLPYSGAQVPDHVRSAYQDCRCAVVFAEATEQVGDRGQPGRGVLIEIGLLREYFGDRIVYLREEGTDLGPMAEGFACTFFTQGSLEEAFYRIVVEFKNWGLV